ncbi:amidohydrolase family protein [Paraburkholderia youngii]|uniref:amidohydrolase family protein n=1 Tax=Paraburkholderia youngii TaxID=2782701 RepID=UPI003D1AC4C4
MGGSFAEFNFKATFQTGKFRAIVSGCRFHLHIWDPAVLPYSWHKAVPSLNRAYLPNDLDAASDAGTVGAMIFVECDVDSPYSLDEIAWVNEQARLDPRIAAFVAHAPVEQGAGVLAHMEELSEFGCVRGVRRLIQSESDRNFCARRQFIAGVRELVRFGWTFDICIRHFQMESAIRLVDACPRVQFALDHIGKPNRSCAVPASSAAHA